MGLRQTISQWIATVKDALDFGPGFPATVAEHRATFTEELTRLQGLLEETRQAAREKDELITRLQAAGKVLGNLIVDGSAYYVRKGNALDGPFCTSCFQQRHEVARIVPGSQPAGADGEPTQWVQCNKCRTPFRSERIGQYLNPCLTVSAPAEVTEREPQKAEPARATRKPRSRQPKAQRPETTTQERKEAEK
jgi:hypothetical protein